MFGGVCFKVWLGIICIYKIVINVLVLLVFCGFYLIVNFLNLIEDILIIDICNYFILFLL